MQQLFQYIPKMPFILYQSSFFHSKIMILDLQ